MEEVKTQPAPFAPVSINPDACIYVRSGYSTCRICRDFCPEGCLEVADGAITFNSLSCLECGICVTVCPSGVFSMTRFGEGRLLDTLDEAIEKSTQVRFTCGRKPSVFSDDGPDPLVPAPCLALLGEAHLIRLVADGADKVTLRAPCAKCEVHGGGAVIDWTVERASRLLETLGKSPFAIIFENAGESEPKASASDRRSFLKGVGSTLALKAISRFDSPRRAAASNGRLPPVMLSSRRRKLNNIISKAPADSILTEKRSPFRVVTIDSSCTVCWACGSYCPTGALSRNEEDGGVSIRFTADKCVKCLDCAELCPEKALDYMESFPPSAINNGPALLAHRRNRICPTCEKPFMPKGDETKCAACAKWEKFQQQLFSSYTEKEGSK